MLFQVSTPGNKAPWNYAPRACADNKSCVVIHNLVDETTELVCSVFVDAAGEHPPPTTKCPRSRPHYEAELPAAFLAEFRANRRARRALTRTELNSSACS